MLVFESCDPGADADPVATGHSADAVALALSRTYLTATLIRAGYPKAAARCGANFLVRDFTVAELNDPNIDQRRIRRIFDRCR